MVGISSAHVLVAHTLSIALLLAPTFLMMVLISSAQDDTLREGCPGFTSSPFLLFF